MRGRENGPLRYTWAFPICPHHVSIDLSVIGALQHDLADAGEPQQGLLYGQTLPGGTQIDGRKPLPAFEPDDFATALESARREVVGFYSIREGSAFILSAGEMNVANEFFRKPGSVVLMIERRATGPAEGTFFFWRGETFVHNLPFPFPIDPALLVADEAPRLPPATLRPGIAIVDPSPKRELSALGLVVGIMAAGVMLWGGLVWNQERSLEQTRAVAEPAAAAPEPVEPHPDLEVTWDPNTTASAKAGLLKINDGGVMRQMALNPDGLRLGSVLYTPVTGRVEFALKMLQSDGDIVEVPTSSHTASTAPVEPPVAAARSPKQEAPPPEQEKQKQEKEKKAAIKPLDRRPLVKRFTLVSAHDPVKRAPAILEAPPEQHLMISPAAPLAPPLRAPVSAPSRPPEEHPTVSPAVQPALTVRAAVTAPTLPPAAHSPASSGRLIWTGTLLRRGVVEVDGRSASLGALTGALPGVPVALTISPAEFSGDGLVVYTTDPTRNNRTEPASARNGWNKIRFVWDPERARQVAVLEAPNPSNQFSRLALRNDARRCSMLLIDWVAR